VLCVSKSHTCTRSASRAVRDSIRDLGLIGLIGGVFVGFGCVGWHFVVVVRGWGGYYVRVGDFGQFCPIFGVW